MNKREILNGLFSNDEKLKRRAKLALDNEKFANYKMGHTIENDKYIVETKDGKKEFYNDIDFNQKFNGYFFICNIRWKSSDLISDEII